jgi:SAM-dependent methyltransferase
MQEVVESAEGMAHSGDFAGALKTLQRLSTDELGLLLLSVPNQHPALQALLPRMPEDQVQVNWTGSSGADLLRQSTTFIRTLENGHRRHSSVPLEEAKILDYGCGWGRLLRLMLRFSLPGNLHGIDPWDQSIKICRDTNVLAELALSDYLPKSLPFETVKFDLIYAFSIFTHTSLRATETALAALRDRVSKDGLLAITVRPKEYWEHHNFGGDGETRKHLLAEHDQSGFAFLPHNRLPVEGDVTYGDTSMTLAFLEQHARNWCIVGTEWNAADPFQYIVFLKAA